jgi:hypothetical protein
LPGLGDEAFTGPRWVLARRGDTMIRLTLEATPVTPEPLPDGSASPITAEPLLALLARAVSRLP